MKFYSEYTLLATVAVVLYWHLVSRSFGCGNDSLNKFSSS